jgi:hypothetical protein
LSSSVLRFHCHILSSSVLRFHCYKLLNDRSQVTHHSKYILAFDILALLKTNMWHLEAKKLSRQRRGTLKQRKA